jgi:acyl-CoA thioester hydrolase
MLPAIPRYPVSVRIPVAWGEMDAYGHVNNAVFVRWMESARMVYLERIGLVARMHDEGVGAILARTVVDYQRPVTYPDTVHAEVAITRVGGSSFTMAFRIRSEAHGADAATGEQVIVVYDYRRARTTPVDDRLRAAIAEVEATGA